MPEINKTTEPTETAIFAGGCFWCLEAAFENLEGVEQVVSGYAGGNVADPSYEDISSGVTGHAETVRITFDPKIISYKDLLEVFFTIHDPTTLNRQGADIGTQYRSVIFYETAEQKTAAENLIKSLNGSGIWKHPIITEIQPLITFYPAEDYHQSYYRSHSGQMYCRVVISPKLSKLRHKFSDRLKKKT